MEPVEPDRLVCHPRASGGAHSGPLEGDGTEEATVEPYLDTRLRLHLSQKSPSGATSMNSPNFAPLHLAAGLEPVRFMHVCSMLQFVILTYAEKGWQPSTLPIDTAKRIKYFTATNRCTFDKN